MKIDSGAGVGTMRRLFLNQITRGVVWRKEGVCMTSDKIYYVN
jgi:hypothetical protein